MRATYPAATVAEGLQAVAVARAWLTERSAPHNNRAGPGSVLQDERSGWGSVLQDERSRSLLQDGQQKRRCNSPESVLCEVTKSEVARSPSPPSSIVWEESNPPCNLFALGAEHSALRSS